MNKFWDILHQVRWILLVLVVGFAIGIYPAGKRLSADPSNQSIFENNQARDDNARFEGAFGSNETIVIGVQAEDLLSREVLGWMKDFSSAFLDHPSVAGIQSLANFKAFKKDFLGVSEAPLADLYLQDKIKKSDFAQSLKDAKEITQHLINERQDFGLMLIEVVKELPSQNKHELIASVRTWLSRNPGPARTFFSGTAVEQDVFVSHIRTDHDRFVPITFAVIIFMAALTQWNIMAVVYPAIVIILSLLSIEAVMVWTGHQLNVVTSLVAPVILIVSVLDPIHYQSFAVHDQDSESGGCALKVLMSNLGGACWMASATTIAGFLSLLTNSVPAIRQFGAYSALGTFIAYLVTILLLPFFYPFARRHARGRRDALLAINPVTNIVSAAIRKARVGIMLGCIPLLCWGAMEAQKVRIETDILKSFKPEDPFRAATETIQEKIGGVYSIEAHIEDSTLSQFSEPDNLQKMMEVQDAIRQLQFVAQVHYVTDIIKVLDRTVRGDDKSRKDRIPPEFYLKKYLKGLLESDAPQLNRIRTPSFKSTRMTVDLQTSSTAETLHVCRQIEAIFSKRLPEGWRYSFAGQTYLLALMSERLVRNQMMSMITSFVSVTFMMVFSLRSPGLGLLSGVINTIPLALLGAFMYWRDIPVNTATSLVAGVAFGIIIDNAIHVLFRYKESKRREDADVIQSIMIYCAKPLTYSILILGSGFAVTLLGSVQPTIQFGLLMVVVFGFAWITNLVLLPAFLAGGRKRERQS